MKKFNMFFVMSVMCVGFAATSFADGMTCPDIDEDPSWSGYTFNGARYSAVMGGIECIYKKARAEHTVPIKGIFNKPNSGRWVSDGNGANMVCTAAIPDVSECPFEDAN